MVGCRPDGVGRLRVSRSARLVGRWFSFAWGRVGEAGAGLLANLFEGCGRGFASGFILCGRVGLGGDDVEECCSGSGAGLGGDGAVTLVGDAFDEFELVLGFGGGEPCVELIEGDVVELAELDEAEVCGEEVGEQVGEEGLGSRALGLRRGSG